MGKQIQKLTNEYVTEDGQETDDHLQKDSMCDKQTGGHLVE